MSQNPVEVLVHIAAPGTAKDDVTYRAQADACLQFRPVSRIPLHEDERVDADITIGSVAAAWPSLEPACETEDDSDPTPPSVVPDSQDGSPSSNRTATPTSTWDVEQNNSPDAGPILPDQISLSSDGLESQSPSSEEMGFSSSPSPAPPSPTPSSLPTAVASEFTLPMEIHPPPPDISSTARFTTHWTPALQMLVTHQKLARRYKPVVQTRILEVCERGYWFVEIPLTGPRGWRVDEFLHFWEFLAEYVGQGRAGWGVWCHAGYRIQNEHLVSVGETHSSHGDIIEVRIFTWGEVVEAIYLLLFIASDRLIDELEGVEWRDASDKAIVRMT